MDNIAMVIIKLRQTIQSLCIHGNNKKKPCFAYFFRKFKTLLQDSFSWHTPIPKPNSLCVKM